MIFSALVVFFALPFAALVVLLFCFHRLGMKISELQTGLTGAEQVQGRAPGSSDHASPIRRTEARGEAFTLDLARTETASARECGECFSPRAPEPSAARVG